MLPRCLANGFYNSKYTISFNFSFVGWDPSPLVTTVYAKIQNVLFVVNKLLAREFAYQEYTAEAY